MAVSAKVWVESIQNNGEYSRVNFAADYNDERNKEWSYYTPSLDFHMNVREEVVEANFKPGQRFDVLFTPVSPEAE